MSESATDENQFQSTPAHQDGRNATQAQSNVPDFVSIHSRPPGREKLYSYFKRVLRFEFQSTPAHQDGRNVVVGAACCSRCFNPLPPTRTGETL